MPHCRQAERLTRVNSRGYVRRSTSRSERSMRRRGSPSVLLVCLSLCLSGVAVADAFRPAQAPVAEHCSRKAAEQVAGEHSGFVGSVSDPIEQVLCGSFAGPGSHTMAVTFAAPT